MDDSLKWFNFCLKMNCRKSRRISSKVYLNWALNLTLRAAKSHKKKVEWVNTEKKPVDLC